MKSVNYRYKGRILSIPYTVTRKVTDDNRISRLDISVSHDYPGFPDARTNFSFYYDLQSNFVGGANMGSEEEIADLILKNEGFD